MQFDGYCFEHGFNPNYRAVVFCEGFSVSETFPTEDMAEKWIDKNNNNYQHRSVIQYLDKNYHVQDSYTYTE